MRFGWTPRQLNTAVRVAGVGLAVALVATVVLVVRNAPEEEPLILEDPYCWSAQPAEPDFAAPPFDFDPVARARGFRDGSSRRLTHEPATACWRPSFFQPTRFANTPWKRSGYSRCMGWTPTTTSLMHVCSSMTART